MDSNIQNVIKQIAVKVCEAGGKMYYVGGYVRDLYLGKQPSDIDVRVIGISKNRFNSILEQFGRTYWITARYDIVKLIGLDIDFSSPINKDGTVKTLENLTEGVDFAMNSILVDIVTGEVVDPFNGIDDIKNKVIRIARIDDIDDEFLAVRACRFKSKLGFQIDRESERKIKTFSYLRVNKQRILPELRKVMELDSTVQSDFFKTALDLGLLDKIFSPLGDLKNLIVECNGTKINAFEHTMRMLEFLTRFKDSITDFEEFYMVCLTYHFRNISKNMPTDEFREFFENIFVTNKIKNTIYYFQDNEGILFSTYNNFQNMDDDELAKIYGKYRRRLEDAGYFVESYNMGLIENPTEEQIAESNKRLELWKLRIEEARALNVKTIKEPIVKEERKEFKKGKSKTSSEYTLDDIKHLTKDISAEQVKTHFNNTTKKRRKRHGRNR